MENLVEKFSRLSGARIQPKSNKDADTLKLELPATVPSSEAPTAPTDERSYVQEKFDTKQPIWKKPYAKLAVIGVPSVIGMFGLLAFMNSDFSWNGSKAKVTAKPESDDTAPKTATPGDLQAAALSNGLSAGFNKEGETKNQFLDTSKPKSAVKPGVKTPPKPTGATTSTIPVTHVAVRRNVPMDYDSTRSAPRTYATPASYSSASYTPSYSAYRSLSRPAVPATVTPRPVYAQASTQTSQEKEKSAQERWMALSTGTSTQASAQSGNNPSTAQSVASASSTGQAPRSPYSAQNVAYLPSESSVIDDQPQSLIHRSAKAKGRLVSGIAFTPESLVSLKGQPIEIEITEALDSQIPKGARIVAVVDVPDGAGRSYSGGSTRAAVRLVPTALAIGDMEIPLDGSAIALSGNNGKPLIAKAQGSGFLKTLGGILGTVVQGTGFANQGAGQNASFGNGSYLTAIGANIGTTLLGNATQRLQQTGTQQSVLILPEQTEIQINILKPLSLPIMGEIDNGSPVAEVAPQPQPEPIASGYREPTDAELYAMVQQEQQDLGLQPPTPEVQDVQ